VKGVCNKCNHREEYKALFMPDNYFPLSLADIDVHKEVPHILLPTCVSNSHHNNDDEYDKQNNKDDDNNNSYNSNNNDGGEYNKDKKDENDNNNIQHES
jgi:hypothetical protein